MQKMGVSDFVSEIKRVEKLLWFWKIGARYSGPGSKPDEANTGLARILISVLQHFG